MENIIIKTQEGWHRTSAVGFYESYCNRTAEYIARVDLLKKSIRVAISAPSAETDDGDIVDIKVSHTMVGDDLVAYINNIIHGVNNAYGLKIADFKKI